MMATIKYQYEKLKSHSEYPVTNTQWKIIDYSLNGYLESLNLKGYNQFSHGRTYINGFGYIPKMHDVRQEYFYN